MLCPRVLRLLRGGLPRLAWELARPARGSASAPGAAGEERPPPAAPCSFCSFSFCPFSPAGPKSGEPTLKGRAPVVGRCCCWGACYSAFT